MAQNLDDDNSVESLPAADIIAPSDANREIATSTSVRSFAVKIPRQDAADFIVEVSANSLRRVRDKLTPYSKNRFSWSEILIGIGGATLGAALGALSSQVPMQSIQGAIFYIVCPMVTVGTFVRYLSESKMNQLTAFNLAKDVLADIPNPDEAIEKELQQ